MRRLRIGTAVAALISFGIVATPAQKGDRAEVLLESARNTELLKGDLDGAIKQYKEILSRYPANRAVAAKALVRLGQCYEKRGDAESRQAFERVVREFGDQKDAVAEARKHLAGKGTAADSSVSAKLVSSGNARGFGESLSQDGRYIAFSSENRGLHVQDLLTGETRAVPEPPPQPGAGSPGILGNSLISPDGKQIAYSRYWLSEGKSLLETYVSGIDGSNRRMISGRDRGFWPESWSPDGKRLFATSKRQDASILISVADGSAREFGVPGQWSGVFSPDGKYIAAVRNSAPGDTEVEMCLVPADGGPKTTLVKNGSRNNIPVWAPDGKRVLFLSDRRGRWDLWSLAVAEGRAQGEPVLLRQEFGASTRLLGFNREGDLYYKVFSETRSLYMANLDARTKQLSGPPEPLGGRFNMAGAAWSPDGERLAYISERGSTGSGASDVSLVIRSVQSGEERVVSPQIRLLMFKPHWFPDGRSLLIHPFAAPLHRLDAQTGDVQPLKESVKIAPRSSYLDTVALAPDGRVIYYIVGDEVARKARIVRREIDSGHEKELRVLDTALVYGLSVSPDGARLAFTRDWKVMTMPVDGGLPQPLSTGTKTAETSWSSDGRWIFTTGAGSNDIWVIPAGGGEARPLGLKLGNIWFHDVHPDGNRIVFASRRYGIELWALKNLR